MHRRHFLLSSLGITLTTAIRGIEPIKRGGKSRFQLGVAAYSFRDYFQWMRDKEQPAKAGRKPWGILDFVDWCADHGVPGAELTSYFFPNDADAAYCREVRRHAYLRGVQICGTAVGNTWALPKGPKLDAQITYTKHWIDLASAMGAPHIRVFAGSKEAGMTDVEAVANCQETYEQCLAYAAERGIFLGMENHGGIVAEPDNLVAMVRAVKSPWAGINFDSGNFHTPDPYADLAKIAPYAVNVQLKMQMKPKGAAASEPTDIPKVLQILRDANYQGWFTLEYEDKGDPFVEIPPILDRLRPLLQ